MDFNYLRPNDVTIQQEVVQEASIALIREFLNRKGCEKSLSAFDEEIPRWTNSICNRVELAQTLHVAPLIRKNKNLEKPFRTIIEIVTWYLVKNPKALNEYPSRSRPSTARTAERLSRSPDRHRLEKIGLTENNGISASRKHQRPPSSRGTLAYSSHINPTTISGLHVTNSLTKLKAKKVNSVEENLFASPGKGMSSQEANMDNKPTQKIKKVNKQRSNMSKKSEKSSNPIDTRKEEERNRKPSSPTDKLQKSLNTSEAINKQSSSPTEKFQKSPNTGETKKEEGVKKQSSSPTEKFQKLLSTSETMKEEGVNKQSSSPTEKFQKLPNTSETKKEEGVKKQSWSQTGKSHNLIIVTKKEEEFVLQDLDEEDQIERKCVRWLEDQDKPRYSNSPSLYIIEQGVKVEDLLQPLTEPKKEVVPQKLGGKSVRKVEFNLKSTSDLSWDIETAMKLKKLIFGSSSVQGFIKPWINQAFTFRDHKDERKSRLRYGIVQKKGGPCGVLAAVQAGFLKHLLFNKVGNAGTEVCNAEPTALNVSKELKTSCLAEAIIEILWRAGRSHQAVVALLSNEQTFTLSDECKEDGITEFIYTTDCQSHESLHRAIYRNINQFETGRGAVILLLYSVILSRGINEVMSDMDDPRGTLMGPNAYCTQEMVNLLTVGVAASNTFDNKKMLENGFVLHGITTRSDVGFLSLSEHYESCTVGSNLKTPRYPIWIISNESHFSVIFCLNRDLVNDWTEEQQFDLYYYDGLASLEHEIRLTVDMTQESPHRHSIPLELCLRTKWPKCVIDWNGTEPLL